MNFRGNHLGRFWMLLEKKLTGTANLEDLSEFARLISADKELRYIADSMQNLWHGRLAKLTDDAAKKAISEYSYRHGDGTGKKRRQLLGIITR